MFLCSAAGMDASAQTGSHELTIPNDVSLLICYTSVTIARQI